ncbi:MAG: hypothetical protein ABI634_06855 [Acidobacteriota bacterium]
MLGFTARNSVRQLVVAAWAGAVASCTAPPPPAGAPTPVYNQASGQLEQLVSDRNGDGKPDTWAFMSGTRITRIQIDRNGDGRPDRWEYYSPPRVDGSPTIIERAEEANGVDVEAVTRHERYARGVLISVDEDTDADGRPDKWETYEGGRLVRVDLDLTGRGTPTRRLVYSADGSMTRVEVDPDGDGQFTVAPPTAAPAKGNRGGSR